RPMQIDRRIALTSAGLVGCAPARRHFGGHMARGKVVQAGASAATSQAERRSFSWAELPSARLIGAPFAGASLDEAKTVARTAAAPETAAIAMVGSIVNSPVGRSGPISLLRCNMMAAPA